MEGADFGAIDLDVVVGDGVGGACALQDSDGAEGLFAILCLLAWWLRWEYREAHLAATALTALGLRAAHESASIRSALAAVGCGGIVASASSAAAVVGVAIASVVSAV